ncbi:WD40 repeat-like protein [Actinomortierella ambigua]|nr:WD40 repeat-like protein [Actinomortierella ambigua]
MSATRTAIFAAAPGATRGQSSRMDADPKGENIVYSNGKTVYIRNIQNPLLAKEYTQHSYGVTVAKYAPSGYYIASADERGNVRIWDTVGDDQVLKLETQALGGRINDLAWDGESKRIIAVGQGKDKYAHAFLVDSGSSCGEIMGHSKIVNAVAIRQTRPFRAVTGGDDKTMVFSTGVPFKFDKALHDHTGFIQDIKYNSSGDFFASVGSDGKIFLYNGTTGEMIKEISKGDHGHKGTIYGLSWSSDGKRILTSSGDQTSKIWDIETSSVVSTFDFTAAGSGIDGQQVGNVWKNDHLITLSLSGDLNYLDPSTSKTARVVQGHQKGITALAVAKDSKTFWTGSYEGRVFGWDAETGKGEPIQNAAHSNQVIQLATSGDRLISAAMDDTIKITPKESSEAAVVVSLGAQPKSISVSEDQTVVTVLENEVQVIQGGKKVDSLPLQYTATAVAINPQGSTVAIGSQDAKVYVMRLEGTKLKAVHTLQSNKGAISTLAFTPDGALLAAGDGAGKIYVYEVASGEVKIDRWVFHSARVNAVAWSPSGRYAVSGSLDTNIYVWNVASPMKKVTIRNAHALSVTDVAFCDDETVVSVGSDASVKTWKISHH